MLVRGSAAQTPDCISAAYSATFPGRGTGIPSNRTELQKLPSKTGKLPC
jgi:hypothetical protein